MAACASDAPARIRNGGRKSPGDSLGCNRAAEADGGRGEPSSPPEPLPEPPLRLKRSEQSPEPRSGCARDCICDARRQSIVVRKSDCKV